MLGQAALAGTAVYLDGRSNRKRRVTLSFADGLAIVDNEQPAATWPFDRIRRADGPPGSLRLACTEALPLARLEIDDDATRQAVLEHCKALDAASGERHTRRIIAWSLAAACSIVALAWFGVPYAADRITPLVPASLEARMGQAVDKQVRASFGSKVCAGAEGHAAFTVLVDKLKAAGGIEGPIEAKVLASTTANAIALPGGHIYLFDGLLQKANNVDEIAGVLAHELGHVKHRDGLRRLIQTGGTSYLLGLLFGDVTGAGAAIFVARAMVDASYSRDQERGADQFAVEVMHNLGRSPKPMGEMLLRVTGAQKGKVPDLLASHPLSEQRLEDMDKAHRPATGPALLTDAQWQALKGICKG